MLTSHTNTSINLASDKTSTSLNTTVSHDSAHDNLPLNSSSTRIKHKIKKQNSIVDDKYDVSSSSNCNNSNNNERSKIEMVSPKLVLPILKINDNEISDVDAESAAQTSLIPEAGKQNLEFLIGYFLL